MNTRSNASETFLQGQAIHTQWESDYLNPDMNRFYDQAFADIVRRADIKPSDHVLDAGCGYCFHTRRLAKSGAKITAVDFSEAALVEARKNISGLGVDLRQADLTKLPFPDASFDHAICWGVLMHVPEMEKAMGELIRVLRPGGSLVLSEINMRAPDIVVRERLIRIIKRLIGKNTAGDARRTQRGLEVWTTQATGGLLVRKTDMSWLKRWMQERGMTQTARTTGELTNLYTNMPMRAFKRAIYRLNELYYKFGAPKFACSNILYFRKGSGK